MRNAFINTVLAASRDREDIFVVSGDAGLGVFDNFQQEFPARFLNLGVAEQNAASFSAGLALTGFKVYLYNIIPFLLYRCYEQVRNDICYQKLPVVLVGTGSGVTYAPQGMTHYAVEDLGIARTLANLTVISAADSVEAKAAALFSLNCPGPLYVRMAKRGEQRIHKNDDIDVTSPQVIREGDTVAIVFHGSIAEEVIRARDILQKEEIQPKLISIPMVQPLAFDKLVCLLKETKYVFCVEEHFIGSGLGSRLSEEYLKDNPAWKLFLLGLPDQFIHEVKDQKGMRDYFGISAEKIAGFIKDKIKKGQ